MIDLYHFLNLIIGATSDNFEDQNSLPGYFSVARCPECNSFLTFVSLSLLATDEQQNSTSSKNPNTTSCPRQAQATYVCLSKNCSRLLKQSNKDAFSNKSVTKSRTRNYAVSDLEENLATMSIGLDCSLLDDDVFEPEKKDEEEEPPQKQRKLE